MRMLFSAVAVVAALAFAAPALAQSDFPNKPVKVINDFGREAPPTWPCG